MTKHTCGFKSNDAVEHSAEGAFESHRAWCHPPTGYLMPISCAPLLSGNFEHMASLLSYRRGLLISSFLFWYSPPWVMAQDPQGGSHGYLNFGYTAPLAPEGRGNVYHIAATYMRPSRWGGSFSFTECHLTATNIPVDYVCRTIALFGSSGGPCPDPVDVLKIYSLRVNREFRSASPFFRVGLEAGPLYAVTYRTEFSAYNDPLGLSNYFDYFVKGGTFGLSLRGKALIAFSQVVGLEVGLFTHLNGFRNVLGGDLTLALGVVRDRLQAPR